MRNERKNTMLCRIKYDRQNDMYCLMLSTDDGETWDLSFGSKCQRRMGESIDDEPMYVSIDLIEEMKKALRCGFDMVY